MITQCVVACSFDAQGKLQAVSAGSAAHAEALKELDEMHKAQERVDMVSTTCTQASLIHVFVYCI